MKHTYLVEVDVYIEESKKCKDTLSTLGIVIAPAVIAPAEKIVGKIVRVDTYYEANNSENNIIAKGCTGTMVYGHLEPRSGIPIYAVVTAGQCCNVEAALYKTNFNLNAYERDVTVAETGDVQSFKSLKIDAHISYGSKSLPLTTVMVIKGTFKNQMITTPKGKIIELGCSRRLGMAFQYQSLNDYCVIHVDPRIQRQVVPILTEDNFHNMAKVREVLHPTDCRLIRWNDNENNRELEELNVDLVEPEMCQDALRSHAISTHAYSVYRFYCIRIRNPSDITFMNGFNDPFMQLSKPNGTDFADVGTPVVCKTTWGNFVQVEYLLGLATLKAKNLIMVMDGWKIKKHLSIQFVFKRQQHPEYLQMPLDVQIQTYTHTHDPTTADTTTPTTTITTDAATPEPTSS